MKEVARYPTMLQYTDVEMNSTFDAIVITIDEDPVVIIDPVMFASFTEDIAYTIVQALKEMFENFDREE